MDLIFKNIDKTIEMDRLEGENSDISNVYNSLMNKLEEKYAKHNINKEPYIVIKSNYGTYGMGVMRIRSADEVLKLNKKFCQQMHITNAVSLFLA